MSKLCECGCGQLVKPGNRFISGHNLRTMKNPMHIPEVVAKRSGDNHHMRTMPEVVAKISKYMKENNPSQKVAGKNHWNKGRKRPEMTGDNNPARRPEVIAKRSGKNHYLYGVTGEDHPSYGKKRPNQRQRMLNGQAAYMLSFVKNPSKPQVQLFKKIKNFFPNAVLNYAFSNYSIDVAIPDLMIAIEYDGSYWHQNKLYDRLRQKDLECRGWQFIRYVDYVPNFKELKEDINKSIGEKLL